MIGCRRPARQQRPCNIADPFHQADCWSTSSLLRDLDTPRSHATTNSDARRYLGFFGSTRVAPVNSAELLHFSARDGTKLNYREYGTRTDLLIVIIHGSSAHGGLYEELSLGLSELGTVVAPDLRGHAAQTPAGDVSYIGQLEDDLTDLIESTRSDIEQKIILVGHSSGGGLVARYSANSGSIKLHGAVLLAPYLGYNAPTLREDAGGWAQPLTRRIIGLTMLNAIGLKALNHLPVISFRLPEDSESLKLTEIYTYRMNTSFAPRQNFKHDISSLPSFKILVGDQDEAFKATEFKPLLESFPNKSSVEVIDGISHLDIIGSSNAHERIREFITSLDQK